MIWQVGDLWLRQQNIQIASCEFHFLFLWDDKSRELFTFMNSQLCRCFLSKLEEYKLEIDFFFFFFFTMFTSFSF